MTINEIVADNLNRLRTERNLSFGQLAERCGVSKVMLSQLERGEGNPTINTLWKIANGLQADYSQLIAPPFRAMQIVRQQEIPMQTEDGGRFHSRCCFPATAARRFDIFEAELLPEGEHHSEGHSPRTQEYILVHQGALEIAIGQDSTVLQSGDAVCFDCSQPHSFRNAATDAAVFTDIVYYQ